MILTDYFHSTPSLQWDYAKQIGVRHATLRMPDDPAFNFTDENQWRNVFDRFGEFGVKPIVLDPLPNQLHDHINAGDNQRDKCIETVQKMLAIMDRLDIRTICVSFMAYIDGLRTDRDIPERGGALASGFDHDKFPGREPLRIIEQKLWENVSIFLQGIMPYAERHGIRIALYLNDPPARCREDVCRIRINRATIDRILNLHESDCLGAALCQGCCGAMGESAEETIRHFSARDKLFYVHFPDVAGSRERLHETCHDKGSRDMAHIIKVYKECEYKGPVRVGRTPTMAREDTCNPGYAAVGRLFAIGYLKGLLDGAGYSYR